jgi:hypothetical protein
MNPEDFEFDEDGIDNFEFEGMSPLEQDAANMHEMFIALLEAGFSDIQALRLVAFLVEESGGPSADIEFRHDPNEPDGEN